MGLLVAVAVASLLVVDGDEQCTAGVCSASIATKRGCVAWRQTAGCTPAGRREARSDRDCDAVISDGSSGYCECSDGSRARKSSCSHSPFTCARACASYERELCTSGFVASATCDAWGPRDPSRDQSCRETVRAGVAGYCACGLGRRVARGGCDTNAHMREPLVCSEACSQPETFYEVMGVAHDASDQEIKKAWRELSRALHPDKARQVFGPDAVDEANARFAEVRHAFDVLSDLNRRAAYDAGGAALLAKLDKEKNVPRAPNVEAQTRVSLETLFHGANLSVAIDKRVVCHGCDAHNRMSLPTRCAACVGRCPDEIVVVKARLGPFMVDQKQKQASNHRCRVDRVTLEFTVQPGSRNGDVVNFPNQAPQLPNQLFGDVKLTLVQDPHGSYVRENDDLRTTVAISLRDALVGFSKHIVHLGGHQVRSFEYSPQFRRRSIS